MFGGLNWNKWTVMTAVKKQNAYCQRNRIQLGKIPSAKLIWNGFLQNSI